MVQFFGNYIATIMEGGAREAQRAGSATIEAEHLLLAIAGEQGSAAQRLLGSVGLDQQGIRDALEQEFRQGLSTAGVSIAELPRPRAADRPPAKLGESARLAIERGMAAAGGKNDLRPAHLLLGVLGLKHGTVARALALTGVDRTALRARTEESLTGGARKEMGR